MGLDNPARPVDARWSAAIDRVRKGTSPHAAHGDPWVDRASRYLQALLACRTEADRERIDRHDPDLDAAFRFRAAPDKLARGTVEARLLAGQTIDEVAAACGLTPGAVDAYEKLFFAVLDRLRADLFIYCHAIGEKHFYGLTEDDTDVFLKWVGYAKGPLMLEQAIRYFRGSWSVPERLDAASREDLEELALMLRVRAVVLVRVLPFPDCFRAHRLLSLTEELQSYIDSSPGPELAACPASGGSGEARNPAKPGEFPSDVQSAQGQAASLRVGTEGWWSAWRAAVLAA
jgi:hypothetical protein